MMTEVITDIPAQLTEGVRGNASLYDRLGGFYGIAATVDNLVDRLYVNGAANANPKVAEFHAKQGPRRVQVPSDCVVRRADWRAKVLPRPGHARIARPS